jgi:uncharacterized protein (TIGR03437 family)
MITKSNRIGCLFLLPLFLLIFSAFNAEAYSASGTYTYSSGTGPGPLNYTITNSDFVCQGASIGAGTSTITSLTATTLSQSDGDVWTRASGTAGVIIGTWSITNPTSGSSLTLKLNADGTMTLDGIITQCDVSGAPTVASFTPASGMAGDLITITGSNFSPIASNNTVLLNGVPAPVSGVRPTKLYVVVPTGATTGTISVTNGGGTAVGSSPFTVTAGTAPALLTYANVFHKIDTDGSSHDVLDAVIGSYATSLVGMTLTVAGPNGFAYTFTTADMTSYINGQINVNRKFPTPASSLAPGVYTFTLDDGRGHISHRVDTHVTVTGASPPKVDSATIQLLRKADGTYRVS